MPSGGTIELCARSEGDAVVVSVVDSGEGIAGEHLPYAFDRSYQVDAARTSNAAGSGLGLSIAKAIVERHHGSIQVASAPGRTAFTVTLPRQVDRPAHSTSANL